MHPLKGVEVGVDEVGEVGEKVEEGAEVEAERTGLVVKLPRFSLEMRKKGMGAGGDEVGEEAEDGVGNVKVEMAMLVREGSRRRHRLCLLEVTRHRSRSLRLIREMRESMRSIFESFPL